MRARALWLIVVTCLVSGGCRGDQRGDQQAPGVLGSSPAPGADAASTGRATGSAAVPAEATSGTTSGPGSAPSAIAEPDGSGLVRLDLGDAGDTWQGLFARAPAGSAVRGDGVGGGLIALPDGRSIVVVPGGPRAVAEQRLGAASAAQVAGATLTFETDVADEIAYVLDLEDVDGAPLRTHGFAVAREAGGSHFVCAFSSASDEAQLATARAVCASITR